MNPTTPVYRRTQLLGLLLIVSGLPAFLSSSYAAAQMRVRDGASGVFQVKQAESGESSREVALSTGRNSSLSVNFPNGMDWQLGGQSRVFLESFVYGGPSVAVEPMHRQWNKGAVKDSLVPAERSSSWWTARLDEGELYISALRPGASSVHVVNTKEGRFELKAASASIQRSDEGGTVIQVFSGAARILPPDGRPLDLQAG